MAYTKEESMRVFKEGMNPVNRVVAGVLIAIGWMVSYGGMYYLAYNNGFYNGSDTIVKQMYASCNTEKNIKFYTDTTNYVCMKVGKM